MGTDWRGRGLPIWHFGCSSRSRCPHGGPRCFGPEMQGASIAGSATHNGAASRFGDRSAGRSRAASTRFHEPLRFASCTADRGGCVRDLARARPGSWAPAVRSGRVPTLCRGHGARSAGLESGRGRERGGTSWGWSSSSTARCCGIVGAFADIDGQPRHPGGRASRRLPVAAAVHPFVSRSASPRAAHAGDRRCDPRGPWTCRGRL